MATTPYDTAGYVLQTAIIMANDAVSANGISGSVLNPAQPWVWPMVNERYRYLQQKLISAGVDTFDKYWVVYGLPPSSNPNQRVPMLLTYTGFFNGTEFLGSAVGVNWSTAITYYAYQVVSYNGVAYIALANAPGQNLNQEPDISPSYWAVQQGPMLPQDLRKPLEIWESPNGGNVWKLMKQASDAISTRPIQQMYRIWDFKNDKLYLPPTSQSNDIKIHGLCMAPDITGSPSPILVMNCSTALAYLVVEMASRMRGGLKANEFGALAKDAIDQIINQTIRKELYATYVKAPFRNSRGRFRRAGR